MLFTTVPSPLTIGQAKSLHLNRPNRTTWTGNSTFPQQFTLLDHTGLHSLQHNTYFWGSSTNCWVYSCSNMHVHILPRSFKTTQPATPSSNDLTQAKAHWDPINSTALSQPKMVSTIPRQSTGQWKIEPIHQDIKSLQEGISFEMSTGRHMLHRKLYHLAYRRIVTQSLRDWAK